MDEAAMSPRKRSPQSITPFGSDDLSGPNVFTQPHRPLEITFLLHAPELPILENAMEELSLSIASFEIDKAAQQWRCKLILDGNQKEEFDWRLENLQGHFPIPNPQVAPLEMKDWVSLVQQHFKPLRAGRFYLYGSHIETPPPLASIPILMDAGAAFGTGEHETTKGCLLAMDKLFKGQRFTRALDMGCGTAVLAIAAAKALHVPVDAVDIDAVSVKVASANVSRNQVNDYVKTDCGNGYATSLVRGPYDLIIANILAKPLMRMARDLRAHLAPGGIAILSGLLTRQEQMVLWAHRQAGLTLQSRLRLGPWSVLVLKG